MADYYAKKQRVYRNLKAIVIRRKTISIAELNDYFMSNYGFGDNVVRKMLKSLEEIGFLTVENTQVILNEGDGTN